MVSLGFVAMVNFENNYFTCMYMCVIVLLTMDNTFLSYNVLCVCIVCVCVSVRYVMHIIGTINLLRYYLHWHKSYTL